MKFGTLVDVTEKLRMQKKFWKTPVICGVMITLKNVIFTLYASMNMLKILLNSQFLCIWSHGNGWKLLDRHFKTQGIQKNFWKGARTTASYDNRVFNFFHTVFQRRNLGIYTKNVQNFEVEIHIFYSYTNTLSHKVRKFN